MFARIRKAEQEREGGFTLIELLVVIIIIGILAAVAIPVFLNQRQKGYDAAAKSDVRTIATLQETYLTSNSAYAPTLTDLKTALTFQASANTSGHTTAPHASIVGAFTVKVNSQSGKSFCWDSSGTTGTTSGVYDCTSTTTTTTTP